jgi:hypothetical protein
MKIYNNPYTQKIYVSLVPLLGEIVAQGVLKSQSNKLGKDSESLNHSDSTKIVEGLKKGLSIFMGSEAASQIANKIGQIY